MTRTVAVLALVAASAAVSTVVLVAATSMRKALVLEMDRDLLAVMTGFYPVERHNAETYAWTRTTAEIRLPGLDRREAWQCAIVLRGARPGTLPQPEVQVAVDGVVAESRRATNEYAEVAVAVPPNPAASGLVLSVAASPAFVPGGGDPRELGVQVDRVECRRDAGLASPPALGVGASTMGSGVFSLFAISGPLWTAVAVILAGAAGLAAVLTSGPGLYHPEYLLRVVWLAMWCGLGGLAALAAARRFGAARATQQAIALTAALLVLKLAALLHPSKLVIDALFNAHRLEWVLAGRYYFTQPMPSGVSFPYAIGLYVVALPFTWLTDDYVMLLRSLVCVAEAGAGLLVFAMVARAWEERTAALAALIVFHLVPLPYLTAGNANLPFAFSQSVAVAVAAAVTLLRLGPRDVLQWTALLALCSLAFLSHVGTFPVTFGVLMTTAVAFWWLGTRELRPVAVRLALTALLAVLIAVVSYYGHFGDSYRSLRAVRAQADTARGAGEAGEAAVGDVTPEPAEPTRTTVPRLQRAARAVQLSTAASGWPALVLAMAGLANLVARRRHDRLTLTLLAIGLVTGGVIAAAVVAP
ncbi:MAG: hypothetical protein KJ061_12100, partial [Vicinamibacteraceae bacterium]|nr:hypothetical protein [Vicinamibacteraceae bacterium]